jgi:hypothetical protein
MQRHLKLKLQFVIRSSDLSPAAEICGSIHTAPSFVHDVNDTAAISSTAMECLLLHGAHIYDAGADQNL